MGVTEEVAVLAVHVVSGISHVPLKIMSIDTWLSADEADFVFSRLESECLTLWLGTCI